MSCLVVRIIIVINHWIEHATWTLLDWSKLHSSEITTHSLPVAKFIVYLTNMEKFALLRMVLPMYRFSKRN